MRTRAWITVLSATALTTAVTVVASGSMSTANATGPTPQPAGTLTLATATGTATTDAWSFDNNTPADTTDDVSQPVAAASPTSCFMAAASAAGPLVSVAGVGPAGSATGFAAHAIGVTQSATITRACSTVGVVKVGSGSTATRVSESLTVSLNSGAGGAFADPTFGGYQATAASLDIVAQDDSKVTATTYLKGVPVATLNLVADEDAPPATLPAGTTYCRTSTSEGGDDWTGTRASCPWAIGGGNFDSITLTTTQGNFSLQGGGEWGANAAAHRTTFSLVRFFDGTLNCNAGTSTVTDGNVTSATIQRLDNGDPTQACTLIPSTLSTSGGTVTFHKPLTSQTTAQFVVTMQRTIAPGAGGVVQLPIDSLTVNWEDAAAAGGTATVDFLTQCPASLGTSPNFNYGAIPTTAFDTVTGAPGDMSPLTGKQYACVLQETPQPQLDGSVIVNDTVYLTGDMIIGSGHH